jgi:hypothetical protein
VYTLRDFQDPLFPAGGNQPVAKRTIAFNDTGIGLVGKLGKLEREECCHQGVLPGSKHERKANQEDGWAQPLNGVPINFDHAQGPLLTSLGTD